MKSAYPLPALLLALLGACETEDPPVDPEADGVLTCGTTETLDGLTTGDEIEVRADAALLIEVNVSSGDGHGVRLRAQSAGSWLRFAEIWDGEADRRVIPAVARANADLFLEVIVPADSMASGSVSMVCADVPEVCFDLSDNDGDGATDCADLDCARDDDCLEDQEDFQPVELICGDDFEEVDLDELDRLSEQRTVYATRPAGEGAPWQEFWGGGELFLPAPELETGTVTVRVSGAGMLCLGSVEDEYVDCAETQALADGDEVSLGTDQLPAWFEPVGTGWTAASTRFDCD